MSRAALFLDRDGIINRPPPPNARYVLEPDGFHLMPGISRVIRTAQDLGWPVVVVTNQKCVALGLITESRLEAIHQRMHELLAREDARVNAVYHCPHAEENGCTCRKPLPGMLLRAAEDLDLDLAASWMIGDQPRDCAAGAAAGCKTIFVGAEQGVACDVSVASLGEIPDLLPRLLENKC